VYIINHNTDNALMTFRYRFNEAAIDAAEEPFEASGQKFNRGSFVVRNIKRSDLERAASELGLQIVAVPSAPQVKTHPIRAARIAMMHPWLSTQDEGWW